MADLVELMVNFNVQTSKASLRLLVNTPKYLPGKTLRVGRTPSPRLGLFRSFQFAFDPWSGVTNLIGSDREEHINDYRHRFISKYQGMYNLLLVLSNSMAHPMYVLQLDYIGLALVPSLLVRLFADPPWQRSDHLSSAPDSSTSWKKRSTRTRRLRSVGRVSFLRDNHWQPSPSHLLPYALSWACGS